ncbi:MAG: FAD-dependent oxidoreductase [Thermoleophilia bacterium]
MLTAEEIGAIGLFEGLPATELGRVASLAADIRVPAGAFAINAGDERALYAVITGHLDTVTTSEGVEKVVGGRAAGDLIGEVPIALGTTFPFSFRASEPARLMRLSAADYHSVAARAPEVAQRLGEIARSRIGGLQGITAEQPPPRALVAGDRWDPACAQLRRFLDRNQVGFRWITPDAPEAEELWGGPLPGPEDRPAIRVVGGKTVVRPRMGRVAELLGLTTEPALAEYDTVIIGAGPAGLAAAVYGASEGLRTIAIEREAPGGQAGTSSRIENYLGFPSGVSGDELSSRALQQARRLGAEILVTRQVTRIDVAARRVHLDEGDVLRARTVILASGVTWRHLAIDGFERLVGKGISYGAARSEASSVHGLDVQIVGAGNSAGQAALFFARHARSVTILCRGDDLGRSMSQYLVDQIGDDEAIEVLVGTEVAAVHGEESLDGVTVRGPGGETRDLAAGALFVFIGATAETEWLPPEIATDERGYILTGPDIPPHLRGEHGRDPYLLETSVPGVFACGDVRYGPVKRVAAAVGEGSMAIAFVHQFLRHESA